MQPESEWAVEQPPHPSTPRSDETFNQALGKAPFRLREDVYKQLFNTYKNIPQYFKNVANKGPAALATIAQHPIQSLKQEGAGLAEMGQDVFNTPHDFANYLSTRLNLLPQDINQKIQMGRMPESNNQINEVFGKPQTPGEEGVRWGAKHALGILGTGQVATSLNPMNLTTKNVANKIVGENYHQIGKHNRMYNSLWEDADRAGINFVPIDKNLYRGNVAFIEKHTTPKQHQSLLDFYHHRSLANAQVAQSDLGQIQRMLNETSKTRILTGEERNLLDTVNATQDHIQSNMFKDKNGKLNHKLMKRYQDISKSYGENVVPYRYNEDIQDFISKDITAKQLVERLKTGEFAAKKVLNILN